MFLEELRQNTEEIRGVGPRTARALKKAGILTVGDLLQYYPRGYEDRMTPVPLTSSGETGRVNTTVTVEAQDYFGFGSGKTLKVFVRDESGRGVLVCFGRNFLADKLKPGSRHRLWGQFSYRFGEWQSSSFEFEPLPESPGTETSRLFNRILPVYSLNADLSQGILRKALEEALSVYGRHLEDEIPPGIRKHRGFLSLPDALAGIHFPASMEMLEKAGRTLKYRELFYLQLLVGRRAWERKSVRREPAALSGELVARLLERLPFSLTPDQKTVMEDIHRDMNRGTAMARLLQGDVGSGKTLVAFLAALYCRERGQQTAFMAPTEILARQHGDNAGRLLEPLGIRLGFLSGGLGEKNRRYLLEALKAGEIDLLVGTHALFTRDVEFSSLGLIIVDEQQRFGVTQRLALKEKGTVPDMLFMTATPIPRTMTMTAFGDLDISLIKTMPPGRKPIETHLARNDREQKVYEWVRRELEKGRQAYFVYPLIGESEKLNLKDAETMFARLSKEIFPQFAVTLIHSRLAEEEKRARMNRFISGEIQVLAATSVVEVGVDVPNASCMVITNAERFGLSALHQLRGRVGRGLEQSYCFLLYGDTLSVDGKARLKVMMETTDGFRIAEEDLKIRGPGDLTGTLQSGFLQLKIADITRDVEILKEAREDAFKLVEQDPGLLEEENSPVREVLSRCPPFPAVFLESG